MTTVAQLVVNDPPVYQLIVDTAGDVTFTVTDTTPTALQVVGEAGPPGPSGPQGPQGPAGGATVAFPFTSAATWTVNHNLGRLPILSLIDSAGAQFDADVEFPDLNTAVVTLATPMSGTALVS